MKKEELRKLQKEREEARKRREAHHMQGILKVGWWLGKREYRRDGAQTWVLY